METEGDFKNQEGVVFVKKSYLEANSEASEKSIDVPQDQQDDNTEDSSGFVHLEPINLPPPYNPATKGLAEKLSEEATINIAANAMPARDFIHYVFGELLGLNYVVDQDVEREKPELTLNLREKISPRDLFSLSLRILKENGIQSYASEEITYFNKGGSEEEATIGVGRSPEDVPNSAQKILQIVPVTYGAKLSTERTLAQLTKAKVLTDREQNSYFVSGSKDDVIRALELINLLDTPANRGRHIGLIELKFIDADSFEEQLRKLLLTEGIEAGVASTARTLDSQSNVVLASLPRLGSVAVFTTSDLLLDRVKHWAQVLDKPAKGAKKRYFTYSPKNARAGDIFASISGLYGGSAAMQRPDRAQNENSIEGQATTQQAPAARGGVSSLNTDELSVVVDERANALILYCTGSTYQTLYPLLDQLDILPKQVLLDVLIAEVTLRDEFRLGVEWALKNNGINYNTLGAFGASAFSGLDISINEDSGQLNARALATNNLVNIVSNPTLLVRDGVTASIAVGSDISVIGNTTVDPLLGQRQTVASEYRKTGVDVTITPTVNASEIIIMEIEQTISNTVPGSSGAAGNPDIFERSLNTQVVAKSGQTIMLAGLISEDSSSGDTGVPLLKRIPFLGQAVKSQNRSNQKTELIMLVTAKVIDDTEGWEELRANFLEGLEGLMPPEQ